MQRVLSEGKPAHGGAVTCTAVQGMGRTACEWNRVGHALPKYGQGCTARRSAAYALGQARTSGTTNITTTISMGVPHRSLRATCL